MVGGVHLSISLLQNCNLIQIFHTRRVRKDQLQVNVPFWRHTVPPHCPLDTVCYRVSFLGLAYVSIFSLRCHEVFQCSLWSLWMNSDVIHLTSCSHFICSTCWKGHKTNRNIPVQRWNTSRLLTEESSIRRSAHVSAWVLAKNSHRRELAELNEHPALIDDPIVACGNLHNHYSAWIKFAPTERYLSQSSHSLRGQ